MTLMMMNMRSMESLKSIPLEANTPEILFLSLCTYIRVCIFSFSCTFAEKSKLCFFSSEEYLCRCPLIMITGGILCFVMSVTGWDREREGIEGEPKIKGGGNTTADDAADEKRKRIDFAVTDEKNGRRTVRNKKNLIISIDIGMIMMHEDDDDAGKMWRGTSDVMILFHVCFIRLHTMVSLISSSWLITWRHDRKFDYRSLIILLLIIIIIRMMMMMFIVMNNQAIGWISSSWWSRFSHKRSYRTQHYDCL